MKHLLIGFVRFWRAVVSPSYGNVCKFYPSCSAYGLEALQVHGAARGSWLIVRRLLRCHPWSRGGYDPVPGTEAAARWAVELAALKAGRQRDGAGGEAGADPSWADAAIPGGRDGAAAGRAEVGVTAGRACLASAEGAPR